jgi:hypothetical protein
VLSDLPRYPQCVERDERVRVAFIAGVGYSGSTLLEQTLSQVEGFISLGELCRPFLRWHWPMMTCSCGQEFQSCPFWQSILHDAWGDHAGATRERLGALSRGFEAQNILAALKHSSPRFSLMSAMREIGELIEPLYRAVASETHAEIIVDSSKTPLWGFSLLTARGVELDVVHLIKDPRAFAVSNGRVHNRFYPPGAKTIPRGPIRSYVNWDLTNVEAEALTRRAQRGITVLYESLARDPQWTTEAILAVLGFSGARVPIEDRVLSVTKLTHTIGGNQRRPRLGMTEIVLDDGWKQSSSRRLRMLAPFLTGPLWYHYKRIACRPEPTKSVTAATAFSRQADVE